MNPSEGVDYASLSAYSSILTVAHAQTYQAPPPREKACLRMRDILPQKATLFVVCMRKMILINNTELSVN